MHVCMYVCMYLQEHMSVCMYTFVGLCIYFMLVDKEKMTVKSWVSFQEGLCGENFKFLPLINLKTWQLGECGCVPLSTHTI